MKILILPSWYPPKGGTFFKEQAELLAGKGHEVHVIAFNEYSLKEFSFKQHNVFSDNNIKVYEKKFWRIPKLKDMNEMRFIRQYLRFAERMFKKINPDIIHAHSVCWGGLIAHQISLTHNTPYVITEHRSRFVMRNDSQKLVKKWHIPLIQKALQGANKIIAVSTPLAEGMQKQFKIEKEKFVVIPNVVLLFDNQQKPKSSNDLFQFIFVGNLEHYKGVHMLMEAIALIPEEERASYRFNILGKGSKLKSLKAFVSKNQLENTVHFKGFVPKEDVIALMKQSDALISSSLYESFGVNIVEALYAGLPVLATFSGGPEEIVNQQNGILVKCEREALFAGIMKMKSEVHHYDANGIRNEAYNKYLPEVVVPQIESVLKEAKNE